MKKAIVTFLIAIAALTTTATAGPRNHLKQQPVIQEAGQITELSARGHLICGLTQMYHYRIEDPAYKLARKWLDFDRTSPQPGAVVVSWRGSPNGRSGHVARINSVVDQCHAVVTDEKGTYERDICKHQLGIVMPNSVRASGTAMSAKRHNRRYEKPAVYATSSVDLRNVH